jgi:hypothetical protein
MPIIGVYATEEQRQAWKRILPGTKQMLRNLFLETVMETAGETHDQHNTASTPSDNTMQPVRPENDSQPL